jgi:hypothetical protein
MREGTCVTNRFTEKTVRHSPNVTVSDDDIQYLWEVTQHFKCQELWDLWCLRVARHNDVLKFTAEQKSEFFSEYSTVITKLQHAADTGYVFSN